MTKNANNRKLTKKDKEYIIQGLQLLQDKTRKDIKELRKNYASVVFEIEELIALMKRLKVSE